MTLAIRVWGASSSRQSLKEVRIGNGVNPSHLPPDIEL